MGVRCVMWRFFSPFGDILGTDQLASSYQRFTLSTFIKPVKSLKCSFSVTSLTACILNRHDQVGLGLCEKSIFAVNKLKLKKWVSWPTVDSIFCNMESVTLNVVKCVLTVYSLLICFRVRLRGQRLINTDVCSWKNLTHDNWIIYLS